MEGTGVGTEDLSFTTVFFNFFFFFFSTHTSTHVQSVTCHPVSHCRACSFPCMDHPVTIVCKQCGEGRRDKQTVRRRRYMRIYLNIYLKEYFFI